MGGWVDDISNPSSAVLLFCREDNVFLLVLVWGEGEGSLSGGSLSWAAMCEEEEAEEEPSLASATGISSRDSAESE